MAIHTTYTLYRSKKRPAAGGDTGDEPPAKKSSVTKVHHIPGDHVTMFTPWLHPQRSHLYQMTVIVLKMVCV